MGKHQRQEAVCCYLSGVRFSVALFVAENISYYEWLTKGKDKSPHFTKQKGGRLMLMAGLYDLVILEGRAFLL